MRVNREPRRPAPLAPSSGSAAVASEPGRGSQVPVVFSSSSRSEIRCRVSHVESGLMPCRFYAVVLSSGATSQPASPAGGAPWWRCAADRGSEACVNKLVGALIHVVFARYGRCGGGRRVQTACFGDSRDYLEASLRGVHQRRRSSAAVTLGQSGYSVPRCLLLRGRFVLLAGVPFRRIFCFGAALHVNHVPSGFVPGGEVDGRSFEALLQRRWRRTGWLFCFSFEVLFARFEDHAVFSILYGVLFVMFVPIAV